MHGYRHSGDGHVVIAAHSHLMDGGEQQESQRAVLEARMADWVHLFGSVRQWILLGHPLLHTADRFHLHVDLVADIARHPVPELRRAARRLARADSPIADAVPPFTTQATLRVREAIRGEEISTLSPDDAVAMVESALENFR